MFTDVQDPARLLDRLGPKRYRSVSDEYRRIVRDEIAQFGGIEIDTAAQEFFIAFDTAADALAAASEIQLRLRKDSRSDLSLLRAKMGVHTGSATRSGEAYVGLDINRAARILAVAHGEQVVASDETAFEINTYSQSPATKANGVHKSVELKDLGRHRLKDLSEPQHLYQLVVDGLKKEFPPLKSLEAFPTNLPVQVAPFIGREREVTQVAELLINNEQQITTVVGPGGVGKTRLALQAASSVIERFPDGVFFVELAPLSDSHAVLPTIAQVLGVRENASNSIDQALAENLKNKSLLLVIDNFEHVVTAAPDMQNAVALSNGVRVLTTSRSSLGLENEQQYQLEPFPVPDLEQLCDLATLTANEVSAIASIDSVALFIDRAKAVQPKFGLTAHNAEAVANICRHLSGIPLAIELAAARVKLFTPAALYKKLSDHTANLSRKTRDVATRHQSLNAALEWSYDLLSPDEQELFKRLSVFAGGWTKQAMTEVCDGVDAARAETVLINTNLLVQQEVDANKPRSAMLLVIRQFALEQLKHGSSWMGIKATHTAYFERLAKQIVPHVRARPELLKQFDLEYENLLEAINWAFEVENTRSILTLAASVWDAWYVLGHWIQARSIIDQAIHYGVDHDSARTDPELFGEVLCAGCLFSVLQGDHARTSEISSQLLELSQCIDFKRGDAFARISQGLVAFAAGRVEEAMDLTQRGYEIAREIPDYMLLTSALNNLGESHLARGEFKKAKAVLLKALDLAEQAPDNVMMRILFTELGTVSIAQDDLISAGEYFIRALEITSSVRSHDGIMYILTGVAVISEPSDPCSAVMLQAKADTLSEELSAPFQPIERKQRYELIAGLRRELGDEAFDRYWQKGRGMSLNEAVELAGRVLEQIRAI